MAACAPVVRWWGRLEVAGVEHLPASGPLLIIANHDSNWDPVAIGIAGRKRRQIRALAKASLWDIPGLAPILRGMGQIPIKRGAADAGALDEAIRQLREGACLGVFPEGTISRGAVLRARSGAGRLAIEVPEAADRQRDGHGHRRHRPLPEAPANQGHVLSAFRGRSARRRGRGSSSRPPNGRDPGTRADRAVGPPPQGRCKRREAPRDRVERWAYPHGPWAYPRQLMRFDLAMRSEVASPRSISA